MNVNLESYGPPIAVLGIALYLGWPPAAPLDLGEDVVRAKSVRWKSSDLNAPDLPPTINHDPFAAVLVIGQQEPTNDSVASEPDTPIGPTADDLKAGLSLSGIAQTDTHRWAIVNRHVCRPGDRVLVAGLTDIYAEIQQIRSNHITVAVGDLTTEIRRKERKAPKRAKQSASPLNPEAATAVDGIDATGDQPDPNDDR